MIHFTRARDALEFRLGGGETGQGFESPDPAHETARVISHHVVCPVLLLSDWSGPGRAAILLNFMQT